MRFIQFLRVLLVNAVVCGILNGTVSAETWKRTFGGIGEEWGSSVQQTMDGGYVIAGGTDSFGAGAYDIYLLHYEPSGMPWIPLLLLSGEDTISMVTPCVDISDMASINEAFSSDSSAPWGFAHYGIDFFPNGNLRPFQAVSAGVVERVDKFLNVGNSYWQVNVQIRLNSTYSVGYAFEPMSSDEADGDTQLAKVFVTVGQKVMQGDIIGKLYTVGAGTHVDFGFYKNGVPICPEPYFTSDARSSILTLLHKTYPNANMCY
jgi:hypothetical protein